MSRVQVRVGAMLVMRRVYEGPDGSEIFVLDESRSVATTFAGLAFIKEWTTSPWSLLNLNGESLMRTCSLLPVGSGMHIDPLSSEMAELASPVERCRHLEALAGGLKSIYMLHAGEDLVVKFVSWLSSAFEGMEAELLEYADEHLLRSSNSGSATRLAHQTSVDISRELIRLREVRRTPVSPNGMADIGPSDFIGADSVRTDSSTLSSGLLSRTDSSTLSSGLLSLAASIVEAMAMSRSAQQSRHAIAVVSAVPLDQLSQSNATTPLVAALPADGLPELAPAILSTTNAKPGTRGLLPPNGVLAVRLSSTRGFGLAPTGSHLFSAVPGEIYEEADPLQFDLQVRLCIASL
jgi:hypothetical protein